MRPQHLETHSSTQPLTEGQRYQYALRSAAVFLVLMGTLVNADDDVEQPTEDLLHRSDTSTMSDNIRLCDHCALVTWVGSEKVSGVPNEHSIFRVADVAKSKGSILKVGSTFAYPDVFDGKVETAYAMMLIEQSWTVPTDVQKNYWAYLKELSWNLTQQSTLVDRTGWFLDYLEHSNVDIATDAFAEIEKADWQTVTQLRNRLPVSGLRKWVCDPELSPLRRGPYAQMLGLCGGRQDAERLKQAILQHNPDFHYDLRGLTIGYLHLAGEEGLTVLEQQLIKAESYMSADGIRLPVPFVERYAVFAALKFIWESPIDSIPPDRLRRSLQMILEHPYLADLVITELTAWDDWSAHQRLIAMYTEAEFSIPAIKRAIIRYFMHFAHAPPESTAAGHARTAVGNLEMLRRIELHGTKPAD